ncbi:MAG: VOC family protein [Thermoplasmata archaeon]|nr:VOC family protein [Thermoplasmata archaeon]
MTTKFQIVFDCADPNRLAHFWADALGYQIAPPPAGFTTWRAFWISKGVPEKEAGDGDDRITDPGGAGPAIWFQQVSEGKAVKNRVHLDLKVSGGYAAPMETRKKRIDVEAERLAAIGATVLGALEEPGVDHYAMAMQDPEGNEFDIN